MLAGQRLRLAGHGFRLAVGGLADRQPSGRDQAINPNGRRIRPRARRERERRGAPPAALGQVAALRPVPAERAGQPQRGLPVVLLLRPAERGPQVIVLVVEPRQPGGRVRARQRGGGLLGQGQVPGGVPLPGRPGFGVGLQFLAAELADRLQHAHPRSARPRRGDRHPQQVAGHQAGQAVQHRGLGGAHRLHRVQRAAAGEHAQVPEQPLFRLVEQLVAPCDRVAHGLLPGRQVVRAVHQHRQPAGQPGQQVIGRQQPAAGPRPARWPAGSRPAGGRSRRRSRSSPGPARAPRRPRRPGPGTAAPRAIHATGAGSRQRQRGDRVLPPGPDAQRRPAGDQRDQARAGFQQPDHAIPGGQHVLEVVQHHEHPAIAQRRPQPARQRGRVPLVHAQLPGQAVEHKPRVPQRREVDEHDPVRVVARHPLGYLDGQPGLADATRAGEDQQLRVAAAQQPDHGRGQPGPADQRGQRPGDGGGADDLPSRPFGPVRRLRPGRGQQARPLTRIEVQRVGQQPDRVEPRRAARIPLQVADRLGADPGPFGQRLLGQPRGQPRLPQQLTERRHRAQNGEYSGSARPVAQARRAAGWAACHRKT